MENLRLERLLDFLKEEPNDPFNTYAIAAEYRHSDSKKAEKYYRQLLLNHPDYLPTYYQLGTLLVEKENIEEASLILKKGIELAKSQNNQLTQRELTNALNEILFND